MDPRYARYPFFEAAREAVGAADVSLSALIAESAPTVERGYERVERGLMDGHVGAEDPRRWSDREELLSYPIARILVSLVDSRAAVEKYAAAEAATARERFVEDFDAGDDALPPATGQRVSLDAFLAEFGLTDRVRAEQQAAVGGGAVPSPWFRVDVGTYLELADGRWGDSWRLVNRELAAGEVRVERDELHRLLQEAVHRRVAEGLPFDVSATPGGDEIAAALADEVGSLRDLLGEREPVGEIDTVIPALFPPCMDRLVERARRDAELTVYERFSLVAFLTGIGMDTEEVVAFCRDTSLEEDAVRYQTEFLRDDPGTQYPPPSCETLHAYDICHNEDDHWKVAPDPLRYYQTKLAEADDEQFTDWREQHA